MGCYWGVLQEPNIHGWHQGYSWILPQKLRALWCLNCSTDLNVFWGVKPLTMVLTPSCVSLCWVVDNRWTRSLSNTGVMFTPFHMTCKLTWQHLNIIKVKKFRSGLRKLVLMCKVLLAIQPDGTSRYSFGNILHKLAWTMKSSEFRSQFILPRPHCKNPVSQSFQFHAQ